MSAPLTLVSHTLCPYVQRAAIAMTEKRLPCERRYVDLADKPDWFLRITLLGKTPVLQVGEDAIFESAAILEYLEETQPRPLHPADPVQRARHRAWIEFGSAALSDIAGFYSAPDAATFESKTAALRARFKLLERHLGDGPYFAGDGFSLVDAVFGPVFRYFDGFDRIGDFGILHDLPKVASWREALTARSSVRDAVQSDYAEDLERFVERRQSHLSRLLACVPG
ncbi:glutathione S-transferase family protein [Maritimibacter sp. 55A14]|uniref:glutathione S-transferase family protein n=1 Tax=Maritimibacter sp. 55A14 TaxID=2174844 RepID=UPI000D61C463|nr:glutathione S-transferase family protein [Maritimibacter sp. 55A14]PWE34004.1 glutathione S-transferase family protein [Maritimibacter sp. 55A14]